MLILGNISLIILFIAEWYLEPKDQKMTIHRYVPSVIVDFAVRLNRSRHGFLGNYSSFDDARSACNGYEDPTIVQMYVEKFESEISQVRMQDIKSTLIDREIRVMNALQFAVAGLPVNKSKFNILDFGGAYGNHYPLIKKFLGEKLGSYVICESESVSNAFNKLETGELSWISNLQEIEDDSFEMVITSCALPYVPNPHDYFRELSRLSSWIVLDRMPVFLEQNSLILKQNASTSKNERVSYPAWFFSRNELFKWFNDFGFELVFEWKVPEDRPFVLGKRRPYEGYLLQRQ